jgi:hypothetical protein
MRSCTWWRLLNALLNEDALSGFAVHIGGVDERLAVHHEPKYHKAAGVAPSGARFRICDLESRQDRRRAGSRPQLIRSALAKMTVVVSKDG